MVKIKYLKESIEHSGDEYCLVSKKSKKNLGCYPTRAGAEKREKQVQYFKHAKKEEIEEMSAAGAGAVEGAAGGLFIKREDMIEELFLRENIRKIIKGIANKKLEEEKKLRLLIRNLILQEAKTNVPEKVHPSTGINVLEDLLKKIIPQLERDYKVLTTDEAQRRSFRSHILNAVVKTLTFVDINGASGAEESGVLTKEGITPPAHSLDAPPTTEDIKLNVGQDDKEKFIDIEQAPEEEKAEEDKFSIKGQDETGRNISLMSYDKIEKNIIDSYSILSDPKDKALFYDYLLTNLKLYFDKFEEELKTQVKEPGFSAPEGEGSEEPGAEAGGEEGTAL